MNHSWEGQIEYLPFYFVMRVGGGVSDHNFYINILSSDAFKMAAFSAILDIGTEPF